MEKWLTDIQQKKSCRSFFLAIFVGFSFLSIFNLTAAHSDVINLTGAGATFPYPLYVKWAEIYHERTGVKINYQSIGSGGGIKQIKARTVDFGATDKPLNQAELRQYQLIQFPSVIGAVVPVVHLENFQPGQLHLTGELLAEIYLGKITHWNDAKIAAINPTLKLPDEFITVVHRSDASGTTFLFTDYLGKISSLWKEQVGADVAVAWPAGIGGKGNEGVASYVKRIHGAIGYMEFSYAKENHLTFTALENRDGFFVIPSSLSFKEASMNINWRTTHDFIRTLTNEPGEHSWPILGATFILIPTIQQDVIKAQALLHFFRWTFQEGSSVAIQFDYIPLPNHSIQLIEMLWKTELRDSLGRPIWH